MEGSAMNDLNEQRGLAVGRKEFLGTGVAMAAGAAAMASGLGGAGIARAARIEVREAAAPVKLVWEVEFTDTTDQKAVMQYLIKPYQQIHPNVSIAYQYPGGGSNIDQQLETQFAAGAGPDLYDENGPSFMPPYITNGDAVDLDPFAKKYGWKQKLSSFALQSSLYKGKLYYLPTEFESLHLWYNKTLMQKNGWKVPTTYDELLTVCKAIKDKGLIPLAFGLNGYLGAWDWWYSYFLNAYLGTRKLYKVLTGQVPWTDPDVATSFNMMKKLWDLGYIMNKESSAVSIAESWTIWGQQKAVMRMEGTWGFQPGLVYANAKNFQWDIAPLPIWKPGIDFAPPVGVGEVNGINPRSKNIDVVADFYDFAFFRNRDQILKWLPKLSSTFLPCLKWQSSDFGSSFDPRLAKVLISSSKAMATGTAGYLSWTAWPAKTENYMWSNIENFLYGKQSIGDYLKQVEKIFQGEKAAGALPQVPKPAGM
jgi:raffinose/stachyose/melibiose transport system substrate-binding protein